MLEVSTKSPPPPVNIQAAAAAALLEAARSVPLSGWDFASWPNVSLGEITNAPELNNIVSQIREAIAAEGFCVIRFGSVVVDQSEAIAASAVTLLATAFGSPFRIYGNNASHWRSLGADPQRPANRSEGIGLQLHHTDFCNAEMPPDGVCLLCLRPDPLGGGASLVAKIAGIEEELDSVDLEALSRPVFRDGQVVNLTGVGGDVNPFPVISAQPGARFRYRFVGHLLESAPEDGPRAAAQALSRALMARTYVIPLQAGDLLLVDQHLALHGRAPLGPEQDDVPLAERRRLLLSFLRTKTQ